MTAGWNDGRTGVNLYDQPLKSVGPKFSIWYFAQYNAYWKIHSALCCCLYKNSIRHDSYLISSWYNVTYIEMLYILTSKLQNTLKIGSETSKRLYFTILEKVCTSIYWFSDLGRIWPYNNERGKFPIYSYHKKWFNLMCSLS